MIYRTYRLASLYIINCKIFGGRASKSFHTIQYFGLNLLIYLNLRKKIITNNDENISGFYLRLFSGRFGDRVYNKCYKNTAFCYNSFSFVNVSIS